MDMQVLGARAAGLPNGDYLLGDELDATSGQIYLTGTQAIARLLLDQARSDAARGLKTAGFASGYRGSPLGGVDQQLWSVAERLKAHRIEFLPAINEELAATAVLGTQRVEADPRREVEAVFGLWYSKGPGVDRAGDALRHGNAYGSSAHGGVIAVIGDDHGCVSSSMSAQSDFSLMAWGLPIVNPANVAEMLSFGRYGWALSRFSGAWVALKAITETVESGTTVDLDELHGDWSAPLDYQGPQGGLHMRWPDLPSLAIEARLAAKLAAARYFAARRSIDRSICESAQAKVGIVTCGKAHLDLMEVFRRLGISLGELDAAGVRIYKVGLSFPLEMGRIDQFVSGLREVLVVEEKGPVVEGQIKEHLYNRGAGGADVRPEAAGDRPGAAGDRPRAAGDRPIVIGKTDAQGAPLISALGELRPSRLLPIVAEWLAHHVPQLDRRELVVDFVAPPVLSNIADATRRMPYFCPGCPHNTSTRLPEGSSAHSGIGCHVMATWMERSTEGLIQMGGEGVDWVAQSRFTATPHIFQNLGDGTYYHSGMLAIRQATAAGATMTYKILYNDAVAMTGGQPIDGPLSVAQVARQVEAEGVSRLAIVSDDIGKYRGGEHRFPPGTSFHDRHELDAVQRQLREIPGVTVLIYDQTCAAQKRRLRKRGVLADPARRLFIHPEICEGCGDCGRASNCIALLPLETPAGRKRRVDQWACNKDYSCLDAECPSFVSVIGAQPRRAIGTKVTPEELAAEVAALPLPNVDFADAPWDLLIAGVGGTGVVTLGALVAMAAHLDGHSASTLDFAGFAQKGGAVLTFVRLAAHPSLLNQARIDTQQADVLLACDLVVGASQESLQAVRHERTRILANLHEVPNDSFVRNPDATLHAAGLRDKLRFAAGDRFIETFDAQSLAQHFLGDTMGANMVALGFAWQKGCVPVSLAALERSIELNDTEVAMNRAALGIGRLAAAAPEFVAAALAPELAPAQTLEELVAAQCERLVAYQGRGLAERYRARVEQVRSAELRVAGTARDEGGALAHDFALTRAFATQYARLLALKDEYEVARLLSGDTLRTALRAEFEGEPGSDYRLRFHFSLPPLPGMGGKRGPKLNVGQWALPLLAGAARLRRVRGTWIDPLRFSARHRAQRRVAEDYAAAIIGRLAALSIEDLPEVAAMASDAARIRGFGAVRERSVAALGGAQGLSAAV